MRHATTSETFAKCQLLMHNWKQTIKPLTCLNSASVKRCGKNLTRLGVISREERNADENPNRADWPRLSTQWARRRTLQCTFPKGLHHLRVNQRAALSAKSKVAARVFLALSLRHLLLAAATAPIYTHIFHPFSFLLITFCRHLPQLASKGKRALRCFDSSTKSAITPLCGFRKSQVDISQIGNQPK